MHQADFVFNQMWNILERTELFEQVHDTHGRYDAKSHLAEMIALLGPPPKRIDSQGDLHGTTPLASSCL